MTIELTLNFGVDVNETYAGEGWVFRYSGFDPIAFSNAGTVTATETYGGSYVAALSATAGIYVNNSGLMQASGIQVTTLRLGDVATELPGRDVLNTGTITADGEVAYAIGAEGHDQRIDNRGDIIASGMAAVGVRVSAGGYLDNSGTINASGSDSAIAVSYIGDSNIVNTGLITASASDSRSIGINLSGFTGLADDEPTILNAGEIVADVAISAYTASHVFVENWGAINGDIYLSSNDDRLIGNGSITGAIVAGAGDDLIDLRFATFNGFVSLGDGDDTLLLDDGGHTVSGDGGDDDIRGGAGDDRIDGGTGADAMSGGDGDDTYYVDNTGDLVIEVSPTGGVDTVISSVSFTLGADIENLTLTGSGVSGRGNDLDNVVTGNDRDNFLRGKAGADVMIGGAGDDRYEVDDAGDQVVEASSSGRDWVYSSISYVLPANVEALTLTGEDWINATGNTKGNAIYGNSGRNVITGGRGSDVMTGKASSDTFVFTSILDSTLDDPDRITDLNDTSDKLDFRQIDGDVNTAGVQGFTIVDAFTGHAGELVLSYDASTDITALTVDVNGDGVADMLVRLNGEHESFDRFLFGGG